MQRELPPVKRYRSAAPFFLQSLLAALRTIRRFAISQYFYENGATVTNLTDKLKKVPGGTRIGQLVVMPIVLADFVEQLGEERGDGGFGSTGDA